MAKPKRASRLSAAFTFELLWLEKTLKITGWMSYMSFHWLVGVLPPLEPGSGRCSALCALPTFNTPQPSLPSQAPRRCSALCALSTFSNPQPSLPAPRTTSVFSSVKRLQCCARYSLSLYRPRKVKQFLSLNVYVYSTPPILPVSCRPANSISGRYTVNSTVLISHRTW